MIRNVENHITHASEHATCLVAKHALTFPSAVMLAVAVTIGGYIILKWDFLSTTYIGIAQGDLNF